jgi:hypothetical protein
MPADPWAGLKGVRLGANERTILANSPIIGTRLGLLIAAPEETRSAQQGYLRAAGKLVDLGLIERHYFYESTRAHDPRLGRPFYKSGRFWMRSDTTRSHRVRRVATWATPFGEGIKLAYATELTSGRPIRWRVDKIARARHYGDGHYANPYSLEESLDTLEEMLGSEPNPTRTPHREIFPPEVDDAQKRSRWRLAVRSARRANPNLGSQKLWHSAEALYRSDRTLEELKATAGRIPPSPNRRALKFTRGELGNIMSTDPEIVRRSRSGGG